MGDRFKKIKDSLGDAFDSIYGIIYDLNARVDVLLERNRRLTALIAEQSTQIRGFAKRLGTKDVQIKKLTLDLEDYARLLEIHHVENKQLQEKLDHAENEIAHFYSQGDSTLENPIDTEGNELPLESSFYARPIIYTDSFREYFLTLEKNDKEDITVYLKIFASEGSAYNSLRTNKQIAGNAKRTIRKGTMKSRAGKRFRFTWEITIDAVHINELHKKTDIINR